MKYTIYVDANRINVQSETDSAFYSNVDDALRSLRIGIEAEQRQEKERAEWDAAWYAESQNPANDISLEELDAAFERYEQKKAEKAATNKKAESGHISPVELTRSAHEMAESWGNEKRVKMYDELLDQDKRVERANKWMSGIKAKGYTDAQAQLIALTLLEAINTAGSGNRFMGDFAEKMREQLVNKLSSFGEKAYPLTGAQFAAAVKAAW